MGSLQQIKDILEIGLETVGSEKQSFRSDCCIYNLPCSNIVLNVLINGNLSALPIFQSAINPATGGALLKGLE